VSVLGELRSLGVGVRRGVGGKLRLSGLPFAELEELAFAYSPRKPELLQELTEQEAASEFFYACPRCHRLDYQPLGNDRRRCLYCGHVYHDAGDELALSRNLLGRFPCPACEQYAYSPGPAGLPQRRCHGCGQTWTPGEASR